MPFVRPYVAACVFVVLSVAGARAQEGPEPHDRGGTAFVGVRVVPMDREETLPERTVLVRDGRIVAVGPVDSVTVPENARVVDGLNGFLMPGLTDLHAHATDRYELPLFLAHGVTRVQYLNATEAVLLRADSVAGGRILGPFLHACAGPVSRIEEPAAARAEVARLDAEGFRCLKPYGGISEGAFEALVDEARARSMRTIGHIPRNLTWRQVLPTGPTAIAHAEEFLYSPIRDRADLERIDSLMVANGIALVPTLSNYAAISRQPLFADRMLRRPGMAAYSPVDRRYWGRDRNRYVRDFPLDRVARLRSRLRFQRRLVKRLADAGVTLGVGTDAGNTLVLPGASVHDELRELVLAGLTPYQALRAATVDAARILGLDGPVGVVTEGAPADLVLVLGDPLADVGNAALVAGVMVRGRWLPRNALDRALEETRERFRPEERMIAVLEAEGAAAAVDVLEATGRETGAPPVRSRALNELAFQIWRIDDRLADAIPVFEAQRRLFPDLWVAHGSLAEAYEAADRTGEALQAYRRAVELNPGWREGRRRIEALGDGGS